jgi:hypothetical protein
MSEETRGHQVTVTNDGPDVVRGDLPLVRMTIVADAEGGSEGWRQGEAMAAAAFEAAPLLMTGKVGIGA